MQLQDFVLSNPSTAVTWTIAGIVAATVVITKLSKSRKLDAIPTIGSRGWLGWWAGSKFGANMEIIQEAYEKYKGAPFKYADRGSWVVVLGDPKQIDELRKAPDDALSFSDATHEVIQTRYTMGPEFLHSSHHLAVIRSHLTRKLNTLYSEIQDEVCVTFNEALDISDSEWTSVHALGVIQKVVCRTSSRVFVGLPLCRNPDWTDINLRYTFDVLKAAFIIRSFPTFLAPIVTYFASDVPETTKRAMGHLAPMIQEQMKLRETHGNNWSGKPDILLSWMLDEAPEGPHRTIKTLTTGLLSTLLAALHTSSQSFGNALLFLAENPQYIQPLREETESVIQKEGWSKASLGKMHKIDSFLRECQRLIRNNGLSLRRKARTDFTFSDGTFIPKGTTVAAAGRCIQLDNEHYEDAHEFNPFRFLHAEEREDSQDLYVSTGPKYLPFGHGKHACPGRFLAATLLKTMLAHVVLSYDVKMEDDSVARPKGLDVGTVPATAKVMFRKRAN